MAENRVKKKTKIDLKIITDDAHAAADTPDSCGETHAADTNTVQTVAAAATRIVCASCGPVRLINNRIRVALYVIYRVPSVGLA